MAIYLQISLKSFFLEEEAFQENMNGSNLLSTILVYPRAGVKSIETLTRLDLEKGKELSFRTYAFSDKILFKEIIEGDSEINANRRAGHCPDHGVIQDRAGFRLRSGPPGGKDHRDRHPALSHNVQSERG
jgi:hypothetical protein